MVWIEPRDSDAFSIDQFPCWLIAPPQQEGAYYGFPMMPSPISSGSRGIKIALHFPGEATDLDEVDRSISKKDTDHILDFIRQYIPSAMGEITHVQTCLYSMTPDEHFVIDRTPGFEIHACMAWGFSGHGFKFASAVGEVLADLSMYGKTDMPVGFLSADRFSAKRSLP
jgi:sarcosine oxidase